MRRLFAIAAALLAATAPISAQTTSRSPSGFVGGLGIGGGSLGLAAEAYLGAATTIGTFLARAAGTTDLDTSQSVSDSSSDLAVLYGFTSTPETGPWIRFAAGPAFVRTVRRGARRTQSTSRSFSSFTESEASETVGLALQLTLAWGQERAVGLGVLGNLNSEGSFAAALVSLHLGPSS